MCIAFLKAEAFFSIVFGSLAVQVLSLQKKSEST
jgi:hypothetical protein